MIVKRTSPISGKVNQMDLDITPGQYRSWEEGMLIQEAMPNLTADEREFIISGVTPEEWKEMFG